MAMKKIEFGNNASHLIFLQPIDGHDLALMNSEIEEIRKEIGNDFRIFAFLVEDWNRDLSPWDAPPVFGNIPFGHGAKDVLQEILSFCSNSENTYVIGGYSLAGLFSLWAVYQSDRFEGVASASPSLWFPGFVDDMSHKTILTKHVYLSLGDRETKTKNPLMASVGQKIQEAKDLLEKQQVDCILEWNHGNHFQDSDLRTAKAFSWVAKQIRSR
ncbi:MAG: hypothetical protein PUC66_05835 [Erysipelotrichaceae bacterium]|nr:hypothetical protein [Erysipelotrichaceae bacterium]